MIGFKQVAKIICDNEWIRDGRDYGCVADETFEKPLGTPKFEEKAQRFFKKKGWKLKPIHLCPYCAAGRPHDD